MVAIKKFLESEDDAQVKKIAMREIRLLKQLRHDNLVNLVEVFRRRKRLYLVFEYVEHTLLDEMDSFPHGLNAAVVRKYMWQLLQATEFCHSRNIIHRDIKPENVLTSSNGVIKLCDFGFARSLAGSEAFTDYVATRWYRSPELLVGDPNYSKPVDVWALGSLFVEMLTGDPLFAGDSDIDQLHHIVRCFGTLCPIHLALMQKNPSLASFRFPDAKKIVTLESRLKIAPQRSIEFAKASLDVDPATRLSCRQLLDHSYFTCDTFITQYSLELQSSIDRDSDANPLLAKKRQAKTTKTDLKDAIKHAQGGMLAVNCADAVIRRSAPPTAVPECPSDFIEAVPSRVSFVADGAPRSSVAADMINGLTNGMPVLPGPSSPALPHGGRPPSMRQSHVSLPPLAAASAAILQPANSRVSPQGRRSIANIVPGIDALSVRTKVHQ